MFSKIANFFIQNTKLTFVLILVVLLTWIWSYTIIPKQYNPTIVVPAFLVTVEAPSLSSNDVKTLVTNELENKIMELEWIDEIFSTSKENWVWVMVKFKVWEDSEKAKIRLLQKLNQNLDIKPLWVSIPIVKSINPDELPQITYAIRLKNWELRTENWVNMSSWTKGEVSLKQENITNQSSRDSSDKSSEWQIGNHIDKESIVKFSSFNSVSLSQEEKYIYLRQIANIIKNELKTIENVTTLDIVWWINKDIFIELDLDKLESKNIDLLQVYDILKKNNISSPIWNINIENNEKQFIEVKADSKDINKLKKILISNIDWNEIFLEDIAIIKYWKKKIEEYALISDKNSIDNSVVFLWIWKQVWTNSVFVTEKIEQKINEIKETLPKNIEIITIQNEWKNAKEATSVLILDLILAIIIVIVILILFLWFKNALNTATSIPLILSLVFLFAYLSWDNINRITLFALILVIWMLVDDSIVVVENMHRHLEERKETWKTKLEAILTAVNEVWPGVILSTITKVLSFAGMFAVTWMMWEYMWPIPKYWIVALLLSIIIAFSINPFITFLSTKDLNEKEHKEIKKESKYDIRKFYVKLMKYFINQNPTSNKKRKIFKLTFWVSLVLVIILPIYFWIFKARMLPKSNQDQVYLWIDWPRWSNIEKMLEIEKSVNEFFICSNSIIPAKAEIYKNESNNLIDPRINHEDDKITTNSEWQQEIQKWNCTITKNLQIVDNISSTIWLALPADFANLFRWWNNRTEEYQISSRINLIPKHENNNRIKSELFAIEIRPLLERYLKERYPDIKMRLLEDPPGPPVRATFLMKISSNWDVKKLDNFTKKVYRQVEDISKKYDIVDLWNSLSTTYKKVEIDIDNYAITKANLTVEQVINAIAITTNSIPINLIKDSNSLEATNLVLWIKKEQSDTLSLFDNIYFTNNLWQKVPLKSIASINPTFVNRDINTDKRLETNYIYAEIWDNSVVYPIVKLYSILKKEEFLEKEYRYIWWSFYNLKFEWLNDWKIYTIEWDWEWKLTMDTFRDLWTAMIIALITIYFLIVWQFKSFAVAWIIMLPFLLWFFGIFPWFSLLYLLKNEYFNATGMIWVISLAWIVVGNAILLIDYINILKSRWWTIEMAIIEAWYIRFMPIMLTSISAIFWAIKITTDPVWSWLARSIVWWLGASAILTLIAIPIFFYDSQKKNWECDIDKKHC